MNEKPSERAPVCGAVVGPVWKLDGESWICELPADQPHEWHEAGDAQWFNETFNLTAEAARS